MELVIIGILALIGVYTVADYRRKLKSGCCGASDHREKCVRVTDRDRSHYPYYKLIQIDGMVCGSCREHLENALNRLPGVWAEVSLENKRAAVRMKEKVSDNELRRTVREAGYFAVTIIDEAASAER